MSLHRTLVLLALAAGGCDGLRPLDLSATVVSADDLDATAILARRAATAT